MTIDNGVCSLIGPGRLEDDFNFGRKIIFNDDAHFWMNGYVNKRNCRIWVDANPQRFTRWQYIHKKLLFDVDFGPAASFVHTSLKRRW